MALFKIYKGTEAELPTSFHEGFAYFTTDEGNLYIDISDTERVQVNAHSAVYAEAAAADNQGNIIVDTYALKEDIAQPDWSQNDESAPDYVHNRTHYEVYSEGMTCTFSSLTFSEYGQNLEGQTVYFATGFDENFTVDMATTYVVNAEGEAVACIPEYCSSYLDDEDFSDLIGLGNFGILTDSGYDSGEALLITTDGAGNYTVYTLDAAFAGDIIVTAETYTVHQLDEKFIPDYVSRAYVDSIVTKDWNQNDPSATDYIENRTHYEESENITLSYSWSSYDFGNLSSTYYVGSFGTTDDLYSILCEKNENSYFDIEWDGKIYSINKEDVLGASNDSIGFSTEDFTLEGNFAGSLFTYDFYTKYTSADGEPEVRSITLSNIKRSLGIHQLDEKYIPDTIARISDVEENNISLKEYIDNGDTSLKEYLNTPIETYVTRGNESGYFTDIVDNWYNSEQDGYQGENEYTYIENLYDISGSFSFTAESNFTLIPTMTCSWNDWSGGSETSSSSINASVSINNVEVFSESLQETVEDEGTSSSVFSPSFDIKKGDQVVVSSSVSGDEEGLAVISLALKIVIDKTEYFPSDFAKTDDLNELKNYIDEGDTSLKEYLDEPTAIYISKSDEANYFTGVVDNWHNEGFENIQGDAYVYNDISSYEPNIEVTLVKDLEVTVRCKAEFLASADGENSFSIIKNGEVISAETKTDIAPGTVSYADFKLTAKAGDVVKFNLNLTNYACCYLYLFEEKDYKEYKPKDFALEAIRNKVFSLDNDLAELTPPAGYEEFFKVVELYDGFSCFVQVNYNPGNSIYFYISPWGLISQEAKVSGIGQKGIYLFTYSDSKWNAIELSSTLADNTLSNVSDDDLKTRVKDVLISNLEVLGPVNYTSATTNQTIYGRYEAFTDSYLKYFETNICFVFVPDNTSESGTSSLLVITASNHDGSQNAYLKKYDASGNLIDPQFTANKPELVMYDGTQFIVIDSASKESSGGSGIPIVNTFTSSSGFAYVATTDDIDEVKVGTIISMVPNVVSSAISPSLALNKSDGTALLAAKEIRRISSSYNPTNNTAYGSWSSNWLAASIPVVLVYNGTYWIAIDRQKVDISDVTCDSTGLRTSYGGTGAKTAAGGLYNLINGSTALSATEIASDDYIPVQDTSASTGKRITVDNLLNCKIVTSAGTGAAYTATVPGISSLAVGETFIMIPHTANTSTTATLNVNSLGAKTLRRAYNYGTSTTYALEATSTITTATPLLLMYNGTYWVIMNMPVISADTIEAGTLPVSRGGTGATTFTSGAALIGNGTSAPTTRSITDNTATTSALTASTNLVTMNTLRYALNRTTGPDSADTNYTTAMMRPIKASTTDLTAGSSSLTSGTIYLVYES